MNPVQNYSLFSEHDIYLFKEGKHYRLYDKFGAHSLEKDGVKGVYFSVWAPFAKKVSVIGNFNKWKPNVLPLYQDGINQVFGKALFPVCHGELCINMP
jgi:1,4-alpha-glucan branching enzyme